MDISFSNAVVTFLIFISSFLFLISKITTKNRKPGPPVAEGSWPLIGHLHLLAGPKPPHLVLGEMSEKYGPIFTIKMGIRPAIVISNSELAKECLTTNDKAFANRPKTLAMVLLGYDRSMLGFSPYGNYWRQIRKLATVELLSNHRLEMFKNVRESEVGTALKVLHSSSISSKEENKLVEMKTWFGDITLNLILKIIVGKSAGYGTSGGWKDALREFFDLSGRFVAADALPFLRWLDIGGYEKSMKKTFEELDVIIKEWMKEHIDKRDSDCGVNKRQDDFMDVMFDVLDANKVDLHRDSDTVNKAICLTLILAASDTTTVTLIWALSLLVNNPDVLKKAQDELDTHVGRERQVLESDVGNLVYLQAIIKETLRLYPAAPLSVPHESIEDCIVAGYHIPAGTMLHLNLWKIHHDPRVWSDPDEFQPERFLRIDKDIDVRGLHYELIPFGSGRRMCPGVSFAMQVLQLVLASVLHAFDFSTPTGELLDMTESIGLTNIRAAPLELVINPRLPSHLY